MYKVKGCWWKINNSGNLLPRISFISLLLSFGVGLRILLSVPVMLSFLRFFTSLGINSRRFQLQLTVTLRHKDGYFLLPYFFPIFFPLSKKYLIIFHQ